MFYKGPIPLDVLTYYKLPKIWAPDYLSYFSPKHVHHTRSCVDRKKAKNTDLLIDSMYLPTVEKEKRMLSFNLFLIL